MYSRGDVYLVREGQVEGSEMQKTRPWVLVSANYLNRARSTVIAVPLTTKQREIPNLCIKISLNNTLCFAVLDQIRAVDKGRLIRLEGAVNAHELNMIDDGLRQILCL
jgi:mRNA interferase MazF